MEPFETYRFEKQAKLPDYYDYFVAAAGQDRFYRTPLYPLFLGVVYKIFGIKPLVAKSIQLLLLVIIAAALPFIGMHYYGRTGFVAGIPAGVLYLAANYKQCADLLTEPLISFVVFLILLAILVYEIRPRTLAAIILGVVIGLALLTKGSLLFIPILLVTLIFIRTMIKRDSKGMKRLLVLVASTLLTIMPWSLYSSIRKGEIIILSTQGSHVLLEMNNEFCVDGGWHPEYVNIKESFYNNDGIEKSRTVLKVANFYWKNPRLFLKIMSNKFINGFWPFKFFWLSVVFLLLNEICRIGQKWTRAGPVKFVFFSIILAIGFLVCYFSPAILLYLLEIGRSRLILLLIGCFGWLTYLFKSGNLSISIPTSFLVIWGNFLLLILVTGAINRYVTPMDFIFILICCVSALHLFINIWDGLTLKTINDKIDYSNL
jgi:4-amino-4-deoxy-L-arabinose transferase-like glycosyltransferase